MRGRAIVNWFELVRMKLLVQVNSSDITNLKGLVQVLQNYAVWFWFMVQFGSEP
jgi:hypothetical protein